MREKTSVELSKLRSKCDSADTRRRKLVVSIRRVFNACEERKDKADDTGGKLRKI